MGQGGRPVSCIFCDIVAGKSDVRVVDRSDEALAFMDAFPCAPGHVLVIPKNHRVLIQDMSGEENAAVFEMTHKLVARTDRVYGTTLVAVHNGEDAGQFIPHVHVHLVPRKNGDGAGAIHSMFSRQIKISEAESDRIYDMLRN